MSDHSKQPNHDRFLNAPVPFFVLDGHAIVLDANEQAALLLRTRRENIVGESLTSFVPAEYLPTLMDHLSRLHETGAHQITELQLRTRDATPRWCRIESRLDGTETGSSNSLTTVFDVSDRKRLEDDLIIAKDSAERANELKGSFLTNMSHEIRTPMNGILAMSDLLLSTSLSSEQRRYVEAIFTSGQALLSVLDDVLDFSLLDQGQMTLERKPFRVQDLMNATERMFGPLAEPKGVRLSVGIENDLTTDYIGDMRRIGQTIFNLATDALRSLDSGTLSIHARCKPLSAHLQEVSFVIETGSDSGEPVRAVGRGTSTGYAVSVELARHMGGQVYRDFGAPGVNRIVFSLPLARAGKPDERDAGGSLRPGADSDVPENAEVHFERTSGSDASPTGSSDDSETAISDAYRKPPFPRPYHILVAEDNPLNTLVIRTILEKAGAVATLVTTGRQAIEALSGKQYDLVLMDISMPEMDGIDATREIRSGRLPGVDAEIPIIAITAHSMRGDRESFIAAGMNDYVGKPFVRETVIATINQVMSMIG